MASSALLLVVVSTLVAFNAWPGGDAVNGLKGLVVDDDQSSIEVTGPARAAADAAPAAAAVAAAPAGAATPPPADGKVLSAPVPTGGSGPGGGDLAQPRSTTPGSAPAAPGRGPVQGAPSVPAPDVQGVTKGAGGTVEQVTGDLGKTVGQVSPPAGTGVTDTGRALSEIVNTLGGNGQKQLSPLQPAP